MSLISRAGTMKRLRRSKAAREKFVESLIGNNISTQIRTIRDRQGLSQERLAELAGGMNQNAISRLESPSYGKPTLTTLKRIAAAFDVGLVVHFVPFSQLADWASGTPHIDLGRSTEAFAVPNFSEEEMEEKEAMHPRSAFLSFANCRRVSSDLDGHVYAYDDYSTNCIGSGFSPEDLS